MSDHTYTRPVSAAGRENARKRAQTHFTVTEQRDSTVKQMLAAETAARDANTAKLRALRLAKEEADREAARNAPPVAAKKTTRRAKV